MGCSNREHYWISKTKSSVLQFHDQQSNKVTMNSEDIAMSQFAVHLGIEWGNSFKFGQRMLTTQW